MTLFFRSLLSGLREFYHIKSFILADLPGYHASGSPLGTIPPYLSSSLSRSDLVLPSNDAIILLFKLSVILTTICKLLTAEK